MRAEHSLVALFMWTRCIYVYVCCQCATSGFMSEVRSLYVPVMHPATTDRALCSPHSETTQLATHLTHVSLSVMTLTAISSSTNSRRSRCSVPVRTDETDI